MIRGLIQIFIIAVVGLVAYNFFLGTAEEKEQSREIINKVKEVGQSGVDLIKAEKEKFDAGKYDDALDKIGGLVDKLKSKAQDSGETLDKLRNLEGKKNELKDRLREDQEQDKLTEGEQRALQEEMKDLLSEIEGLTSEMSQ